MSGTEVAKLIRKELKGVFPKGKFSVRTGGGVTSTSINVGWNDGASQNAVKKLIDKHSKIDYDQRTQEILGGGNTFIFTNRKVSEKNMGKIQKKIQKKYGQTGEEDWGRKQYLQQKVWEKLNETGF